MNRKNRSRIILVLMALALCMTGGALHYHAAVSAQPLAAEELPQWNGSAYVELQEGEPDFSGKQKKSTDTYVRYSELDALGRAGRAVGCLSRETVNEGPRESIGQIRPVGWEIRKYPDLIKDRYVYNRCHLFMQAAAAGLHPELCNSERNIITGTRYMNVDGMLPFETELLSYLRSTSNHVLYRVTPLYEGNELVARGVQMEAWSVEDGGRGLKFNVFCFNVQPGIVIDYATGRTRIGENAEKEVALAAAKGSITINEAYAKSRGQSAGSS
ncbi:MAG: DNA/RNA non-specific endonuclease, partial [Lachnospiraceae bacterium]|nr:DNA/RNA non-specific endonuclease [Lachnospiraceae bacterium]